MSDETRLSQEESKILKEVGYKFEIQCHTVVDSTMDVAKRYLENLSDQTDQLPQNQVGLIMSQEQTNGRGRLGREWKGAESSFLATYFMPARYSDPKRYSGLSLVVGLVLHKALANYTNEILIKWPNDIYSIKGKKLSGILIEFVKVKEVSYVLVGIGINLNLPPNAENSISLFDLSNIVVSPYAIATNLIPELNSTLSEFEEIGFSEFKNQWLERAYKVEDSLTVTRGKEKITGTFVDVTDSGELLLKVDDKVIIVV